MYCTSPPECDPSRSTPPSYYDPKTNKTKPVILVIALLAASPLLILQEMRANIDLEFVLHLLGLAGQLVPDLTSEEVLAKMCRKKAKLAVRHTVRRRRGNSG